MMQNATKERAIAGLGDPGGGDWGAPAGALPLTRARAGLVEQAQAGDARAFERLVEAWIEPAFRTALAILGREADARDAVQESLLDAWRNFGQLRDADRFDAWIGRILVNACRTAGRRRGRTQVREISVSLVPEPDEPAGRGPGLADASADLDELERAFEHLKVDARTVLVLHHLQHRPVGEIARVLGVPEGTVKWRLHEARSALAKALKEERR